MLNDIKSMKNSLLSVTNTSNFMWMTINRCIDYTKASSGIKLIPKNETTNLKKSLEIPIKCVTELGSKINIKLKDIPNTITDNIITDKQWLQENILCLVSNAAKFSTEGIVTVEVSKITDQIVSDSNKLIDYLKFEIKDNGIGLSETAMHSLFEPFKQAQRMAGGTGLGLYSLKKRNDALGGKYGVSKRKDELNGSLFWFTIPYKPDISFNSMESFGSKQNIMTPTMTTLLFLESLRVLIVDDSPSILKLSSQMLRRKGFLVEIAENGSIALDMMINASYDIVLMDLQMPVMDGKYQQKQQLLSEKNNSISNDQLVIGLSANSDDETIREAYQAGINDFLSKPFKLDSFIQKLSELNVTKIS